MRSMERSEEQIVADLKEQIRRDSSFAIHVFRTIWSAQQPIEKFTGKYAGSDGVGFQPHMTEHWNRVFDLAEATGWKFTAQEMDELREGMVVYAGQFRRLTAPRLEARRQEVEA